MNDYTIVTVGYHKEEVFEIVNEKGYIISPHSFQTFKDAFEYINKINKGVNYEI